MGNSATELKQSFLRELSPDSHFEILFDHLPGVSFFAKNRDFQIVSANRAFWKRLGCDSEADVIGRNDFNLFPDELARKFRQDDERIIQTGEPMLKIVELFFNRQGLPDWYFTNKFPVFGKDHGVIGVMGTVQSYSGRKSALTPHLQLDRAVSYIREHFQEPISMTNLARRTGMSVRQFNRRFREVFGTNPRTFLIKTRIQAACVELRSTDIPISDIALDFGFSDQSSFTQHFRKHMGITPFRYRKES
ncbi:MAG: transcriptional regulator [Verrucomicrobiales bacterium]|jgi:PAS domain S-box-containing protein|nr:transcriptional regulator [Verrucomicrobiales bacterium]|tara:strand:+ start:11048 stop:11791 length:744 start_codon:yes stop_codon:yes gene_type:complete